MILQTIKAFALLGGEWVLYILIVLSIWCMKVILERFFFFRSRAKDALLLGDYVPELLAAGKIQKVRELVEKDRSVEGVVLKAGLSNLSLGLEALEQILESRKIQEKMGMEKDLLELGTLGN